MEKVAVLSNSAPAAIGPYSQGIRVGDMLFMSGQIPLDPVSGQIVGEDAAEQVRQVFKNMDAVLAAAGGSLDNIVKTTVFLTDLSEFQEVNAVYGEYFQSVPPARSAVQVSALPRGARVEIESIAVL